MTVEQEVKEAFKGRPYKFSHMTPETQKENAVVYFQCPVCGGCSFPLIDIGKTSAFVDEALIQHGKMHAVF